jgi:uncharacterized protein
MGGGLERFARAFAEAGFVVLVHDHRNFGTSAGAVRHDIDPWREIADWRRAISFLETPEVDLARIGIWGTSYGRDGSPDPSRRVPGADDQRPRAGIAPDAARRHRRARASPPRRQQVVSDDPSIPASYRAKDAIDFYLQPVPAGVWENSVTVRSTRLARAYEPGIWISRVSPAVMWRSNSTSTRRSRAPRALKSVLSTTAFANR